MIIAYVLKSAIVLAALYGVFFAALQRETFHRLNRCVILASVAFSLVAPLLRIDLLGSVPIVGAMHGMAERIVALDGVVVNADGGVGAVGDGNLSVLGWMQAVYLAGVAFMALRLVVQAVSLVRNLSSGARCSDGCGNTVVLKSGNVPPYSIFRYIVMSVADYEHNRRSILTHEQEHIRLGHTYDKLLMELAKCVQWFNPTVWLFARDLDAVHEYEADEAVIRKGIDAKTYQTLLVLKAVGNRLQPFANNLNRGSLKRRIIMMNQKKSSGWMMLKALFVVPAAVVAVSAFAVNDIVTEPSAMADVIAQAKPQAKKAVAVKKHVQARKAVAATKAPSSAVSAKPAKATASKPASSESIKGDDAMDVVEVMPEFPGGDSGLMNFLSLNVKYPAAAKAAKKQGRAVVRFVVDTDGKVCDARVEKSAGDAELDAEALRVVNAMPKWTPGKQDGKPVRVRYMVPLTFRVM